MQEGWPDTETETSEELQPYVRRKLELSVGGGCVLWECRVVVPTKGRVCALRMLHEGHPQAARMMSLARGYIWWPGVDREIEDCVKDCTICQMNRKDPPVTPTPMVMAGQAMDPSTHRKGGLWDIVLL